jgi:hypothetical protein
MFSIQTEDYKEKLKKKFFILVGVLNVQRCKNIYLDYLTILYLQMINSN